ncbi:MAG: nitroreductase family protein [Clostridia bacterium]|nr:nitroreductase family protein [Clostridia bacterium]
MHKLHKMYKMFSIGLSLLLLSACTGAPASSPSVTDIVSELSTTQYFLSDAVAEEDAEKILTAGINSQSGMNAQPWHFSAVSNAEVLSAIANDMSASMPAMSNAPSNESAPAKAQISDAPLAIVVSCKSGSDLDAGLACQSMAIQAGLLGYGTKIVSSPKVVLNGDKQGEYKKLLGIPDDMQVVTVLLVGKKNTQIDETLEGYTGATTRNSFDAVVTLVD